MYSVRRRGELLLLRAELHDAFSDSDQGDGLQHGQKTEASVAASAAQAEAEAEVAKIQAQANLEVAKLQADATEYAGEKEAAKNKAISEELTEDLLRYYLIQQWDGKYPETYVGSEGVANIILNSGNKE